MTQVPSDEEVGRQILGVFLKYKIRPGGTLRRNHFAEVRDADFQRGIRGLEQHLLDPAIKCAMT